MGIWAGHHYLASNVQIFKNNGLWRFVEKNVIAHSQDFGELAVNAPFSKLPPWSHGPMLIIGGAAWLLFFAGIAAVWQRSQWLSSYLIAYSGLIFPWPFTDPRFWLPAMPLVVVAMHAGLMALFKTLPRGVLVAYGVIFCVLGFAALGYSTRLTFSGPNFAYRYGDGRLTSAYLAQCTTSPTNVDQAALHLLRRYEWHCRDVQ